ncbi:MAG: flagellar M-ring protein FliF [Deltaproteobacteria bacterium]|nr:flagellar M-ring protein FliF [Deltaproteobacteria bacterium]MBW2069734.1 flagellar M-ring protein FliF [Deltaproteobacteria bacterium]
MKLLAGFKDWFVKAPMSQKLGAALGLSLVIGTVATVALWSTRPDYQVLFSQLEADDAAAIVDVLKQEKVPYQLKANGSVVLVPREKVYELRLELASSGIPRGGGVGFEIFDNTPLGTTEFVQKLNYQRALQGELARSINQFDAVQEARVHIVTPRESLFVEDEKPATASVVLRLQKGRTLSKRQIDGIVHLVASAVEGLEPQNITVVDIEGGVLYKGQSGDTDLALSNSQLEYQRSIEASLEQRIQEMLERVTGPGHAVAKVTAEVDFRKIQVEEERYDPESAVIRSEQRQTESTAGGTSLPGGAPEEKYQFSQNSTGSTTLSSTSSKKQNEVINYEINRVSRQITGASGEIKRLSAAVVIDGTYRQQKEADGKVKQVYVPRTQEEMKRFEGIVKKAIGYDAERGDQVEVINLAFAAPPEAMSAGEQSGSSWLNLVNRFSGPLIKVVVVVLVFFFVVRPMMRRIGQMMTTVPTSQQPGGLEVEYGSPESLAAVAPRQQVMQLAQKDPEKTAALIKGWLHEEE